MKRNSIEFLISSDSLNNNTRILILQLKERIVTFFMSIHTQFTGSKEKEEKEENSHK